MEPDRSERVYEVVVLGGGVNGLATARGLVRAGATRIALVEQHALGHAQGSSHGPSRITRSAYADRDYVALLQEVHGEAWPALEAEAGERLLHRVDGCLFGPLDGCLQDYAAAVAEVGVDVVPLALGEARRRFPAFHFGEADGPVGVLWDRTAGLVAAAQAMKALERLVRGAGVTVLERCPVTAIDRAGPRITLHTPAGLIQTEKLVITAGPWTAKLLPALGPRLTVLRQTVAYADLGPAAAALPVWIALGRRPSEHFYGLPAFGLPGARLARHRTAGPPDDPDGEPGEPAVAELLDFIRATFAAPFHGLLGLERCLYTATEDEDFILDRLPGDERVTVGAGFSGHGFKFAPLTGRVLAELCLHGQTGLPAFEAARARFRFPGAPSSEN